MYQEQLNQFIQNGTYTYKLDSVGNFVIDDNNPSFETKYLNVGLYDYYYNINKIQSITEVQFNEFVPTITVPIDTNVNTSTNFVESILRASGSLNISSNGITITPEALAELEYAILQLKAERDDANTKLNTIVSQLTPPS
jgi:hypothetical protein